MSFDLGEGKYQIIVDADQATASLKKFEGQAATSGSNAKKSFGVAAAGVASFGSAIAATAFSLDNLQKSQLRSEQAAQKVAKAQERIRDIQRSSTASAEDLQIAQEDLRLATQRYDLAVGDATQANVMFGFQLTFLATSTIPAGIKSIVDLGKAFTGLDLVTKKYVLIALAVIAAWEAMAQIIKIFNPELGKTLSIIDNVNGMLGRLGRSTSITTDNFDSMNKSTNELVNTFEGNFTPALGNAATQLDRINSRTGKVSGGIDNIKKKRQVLDDTEESLITIQEEIENATEAAERFASKLSSLRSQGIDINIPEGASAAEIRFKMHAATLFEKQLRAEEELEEKRHQLILKAARRRYENRQSKIRQEYRNLSIDLLQKAIDQKQPPEIIELIRKQIKNEGFFDPTAYTLSDERRDINDLLGKAIAAKLPKESIDNLRQQLRILETNNNQRNITAGGMFGVIGADLFMRTYSKTGITRLQTEGLVNTQFRELQKKAAEKKGRRTGVTVSDIGYYSKFTNASQSSQEGTKVTAKGGKRGRRGLFTPAQIAMMNFRKSLDIDDQTSMLADFLGINVPDFARGVGFSQSRASRESARQAAIEAQNRFNQQQEESRKLFINSIYSQILGISKDIGLSQSQVISMISTSQGRNDVTGMIDFQKRLKLTTSGVGF